MNVLNRGLPEIKCVSIAQPVRPEEVYSSVSRQPKPIHQHVYQESVHDTPYGQIWVLTCGCGRLAQVLLQPEEHIEFRHCIKLEKRLREFGDSFARQSDQNEAPHDERLVRLSDVLDVVWGRK